MHSNALVAGYRFNDLKRARIISSRGDLFAKQRDYNFPKPVKLSARAAWWPAEEVHDWLKPTFAR
jgi:predicted DNA-binding transcriptional regulator AlpA